MNDKLIYARALEILDEIDGMIPCCLRSDGRGGETEYSLIERVDILLQSIPKAEAECDRLRAERDEYRALLERAVKQADSILDRWDASLGGRSPRTT